MYRTIVISGVSAVNMNESFFALNVESVTDPTHVVKKQQVLTDNNNRKRIYCIYI